MGLVRSTSIRGFREVVTELGGDPEDIAVRVGLPVEALTSGSLLVRDSSIAMALEVAAAELECPDLGLRVGSRQEISALGPLGIAVRHAATLEDALHSVTEHLFVHAEGMRVRQVEDPLGVTGVMALQYDAGPGRPMSVQGTALVLAFLHRSAMQLAGGAYGLRSIDLPHSTTALESYRRHFGVPVHPQRPVALMRVSRSLATVPLTGRDDDMRRVAEQMLTRHRPHRGRVVDQVRDAIAPRLRTGAVSIGEVAGDLAVHPRTLQRMLASEQTSFGLLLDDVRRQTAKHLLTSTRLTVAQVAAEVGYAEVATFSRKARTWWSATPTQVRQGSQRA